MMKLSSFEKQIAAESERQSALYAVVCNSEHALCDTLLRVRGSEAEEWVSIGSNSAVLRMKSSVLDAMWQSDSSAKGVESIDIADCSEEAIRALNAVAFGQMQAVEITTENVADLLYAALKYDFKLVVDCCQQFIDETIAKDDVSQWLPVVSALYKGKLTDYASKVAAKCKLFGSKKTTAAFECEAVTTLPFALFRDLLKDDALRLSEESVWKQSVKWAKQNGEQFAEAIDDVKEEIDSVQRVDPFVSALRSLKAHIRFPLMELDFFVKEVGGTHMLTDSEFFNVCMVSTGTPIGTPLFCSSKPRAGGKKQVSGLNFDCFDPRYFQVSKKGAKEVLRVTGDRRALFGCSKGWRTGVHKWRVAVDECTSHDFGLGVSQNCDEFKVAMDGSYTNVAHVAYVFGGSRLAYRLHKGMVTLRGGWVRYKQGDTVEFTLDLDKWTLTAMHNGTTQRSFAVDRDHCYAPVVMSFRENYLVQATVEF